MIRPNASSQQPPFKKIDFFILERKRVCPSVGGVEKELREKESEADPMLLAKPDVGLDFSTG